MQRSPAFLGELPDQRVPPCCLELLVRVLSRTLLSLSALTLTSTAFLIPTVSASAAPFIDRDHDKMSDRWERDHGLKVGVDDRFRDPDSDHLVNVVEFHRGTKPHERDSDNDGLRDGREVRHFKTNPRKADTDRDGLRDAREVRRAKTNPLRSDTDRDGLSDGDEVNRYSTGPNNADSDDDGLTDGDEVNIYGTDGLKRDSDGDGLPDVYEIRGTFTNPLVADTDSDGVNDATEVYGGTDPNVYNAPSGTTTPAPGTPEQFTGLIQTLRSLGLDPDQLQAVVDQIVGALAGGQLSPEDLAAMLEPVVEAFSDAGLPADQVSDAILQVLAALSSEELPSDPSGLLDLVIDALQEGLAGTPLTDLNPILEQVQDALDDILGGILGGLPIP